MFMLPVTLAMSTAMSGVIIGTYLFSINKHYLSQAAPAHKGK